MKNKIRIGTRKSELALKQAHTVGELIESKGGSYKIVEINSEGDLNLKTPLNQLGFTGVFTKALDIALLENKIDIAVHSLKDVPTILPNKIIQSAVLKRDNPLDILVKKDKKPLNFEPPLTIATGSIRRKAQWLHKYPNHIIDGLRGNVNTRLQKLQDNNWNGAIFSHSGLDRIKLIPDDYIKLDWMVSAPAQGVVSIVSLKENKELFDFIHQLNHKETEIVSTIERDFLNELEGGCSAPIGAIAIIKEKTVHFKGILTSVEGKQQIEIQEKIALSDSENFGRVCAQQLLINGGKELMEQFNNSK
jgi:hydroxymethylbilane synthase